MSQRIADIYIRVSTQRQAEQGHSLDNQQEEEAVRFATQMGYQVGRIYREEGRSARTDRRPQFRAMLDAIKRRESQASAIIVYKLDRFSRNSRLYLETKELLTKRGVRLLSVQEQFDSDTASGALLELFLTGISEFESRQIGERTRRGNAAGARKGRWQGARHVPYGFVYAADVDESGQPIMEEYTSGESIRRRPRRSLRPHPEEAEVVRQIYRLYDEGTPDEMQVGIYRIVRWLNENGYRTRTGREWQTGVVTKILRNPIYKGIITWGAYEYEELLDEDGNPVINPATGYPVKTRKKKPVPDAVGHLGFAIVDPELWERVNRKLNYRSSILRRSAAEQRATLARKARTHVLSGILRCPDCGGPMEGSPRRVHTRRVSEERRYITYRCHASAKAGMCRANQVPEHRILPEIVALAAPFLLDTLAREALNRVLTEHGWSQQAQTDEDRIAAIERRLREIADEAAFYTVQVGKKRLTPAKFEELMQPLDEERERLERELDSLRDARAQADRRDASVEAVFGDLDWRELLLTEGRIMNEFDLFSRWNSWSPEQRRDLMVATYERLVLDRDGNLHVEYRSPIPEATAWAEHWQAWLENELVRVPPAQREAARQKFALRQLLWRQ